MRAKQKHFLQLSLLVRPSKPGGFAQRHNVKPRMGGGDIVNNWLEIGGCGHLGRH